MMDQERADLIYRIEALQEQNAMLMTDLREANARADSIEKAYDRLKISTIGTRAPYDEG